MKQGYIIGIAGELNSGKDTLASMINYIVAVGTSRADYANWATKQKQHDLTYANHITHFADPMKDCLSIMYNIPREYFEDRDYKDNKWYILSERRFVDYKDIESDLRYRPITVEMLDEHTITFYINTSSRNNKIPIIKLRTLMQYFGTEVARQHMGHNIWVDATIGKAADIADTHKLCIIPDVRFINEHKAIVGNLLYGQDIEIKRNNINKVDHSSETIDFKCSTIITNNGTKLQLFYKALKIVQDMFNK